MSSMSTATSLAPAVSYSGPASASHSEALPGPSQLLARRQLLGYQVHQLAISTVIINPPANDLRDVHLYQQPLSRDFHLYEQPPIAKAGDVHLYANDEQPPTGEFGDVDLDGNSEGGFLSKTLIKLQLAALHVN